MPTSHRAPRSRLTFVWLLAVLALLLSAAVFVRLANGGASPSGRAVQAGLQRVEPTARGPAVDGGAPGSTAASPTGRAHPAAPTAAARPSPSGPPSNTLRLDLQGSIGGAISPKSVVASQHGLFFAQNMMYRHSITVYDRSRKLVRTIQDSVRLADLGHPQYRGTAQGAPVEAAFSPDGRYAYVSNYSMYGSGFGPEGHDVCSPASGYGDSFLYRIDVTTFRIDQAIRVGAVPKYVATTPDGKYVLVSNWCSYSLSVVSVAQAKEVRRIQLGPYPRGIAVDPASDTAYVAVMGTTGVAAVDLGTFSVRWMYGIGLGPRHVLLSPSGRLLYVTLNRSNAVAKIDPRTGRKLDFVTTGINPRSMAMAPDGRSLYVVNYSSGTMSKVTTSDMHVVQVVHTAYHPIGITYDGPSGQAWVSCYGGSIMVFADR
jgi:YVTN family beta-propeller protein